MSRRDPKKHADLDATFKVDKDLNEVWPEVIAEFERVTEKKLDPGTTFESFQLTVNERLRDATSKRSSNARKILNNVGQCLQQFGSIIAGGAGMVFGPSAQCWNAISFVITAAQKYSEVLDGFVTLMERCAAFLSRLNLFLEQECGKHGEYLPSHVRKPAYAILSHFIDILRHSYKLSKSKREKFKLVLEIVLFSGDAGVQSSLDLLERHVQDFTNTQIDQILVDVKGLARYLQESDETRQRHQAEIREHLESIYEVSKETLAVTQQVKITLDGHITQEKNREDLEKIRKAFGLKSGEEPWTKRHDHICKARAKDSCRWLIEREDLGFLAWADIQNRQKNTKILTVEGNPGYGKTFISNKVVSCLHDMYRNNNSADRVSIAYYYYGEDREDSLEKCIRCIIYQFASTEPAYARAVAEACQAPGSIATAEDIWDRLLVKVQHTMKGTYYICIDGYACSEVASNEDAIGKIAQSVLSSIKGISVRLYFSGTNEAVARIPQEDRAIRTIVLGPVKDLGNRMVRLGSSPSEESTALIPLVNASDLEAFALARVDELGEKKPDLKTVMTETNIKKLVAGVYGNYEHLEAKIVQINACDTEQKIQDVIDSTGDDLMTTVRSSLKVSSEALNSEQIRLLNEILIWVVGHGYPDIDFLQSALYLAFRKTFMVRDMIATTFSGFLAIDENDRIKLKSDQILQILREESQSHVKLSRPGSATTELSQAEIDLCSHIVKNVCGEYVYGRFNFDGFFNSLAGKQNAAVELADENALNVTITSSLLQALCELKDEKHLKTIRLHASIWFYEHIKTFVKAIDYFEPERDMLTEIGSKLSQVLYETEYIDNWFSTDYSETLKADLVVGDNFLEPMQKILRNPHAAKGYSQDAEKKKWIESVIGAEASKYAILGRAASMLGNVWFTCKTMTDPRYLWIPYGIFSKETTGKFDPDDMPVLTQVADYLQWIQKSIGLDTNSPIWSFRVGATYSAFEHYDEALRIFKEVEAGLQDNWCLLLAIAETYVGRKEFSDALLYLHKLKDLHNTLIDTDSEFKKMYWERVVLPEGNCHRQVKDYDSAIHCYREILLQEIDSESYPGAVHAQTLTALFGLWNEIDQHSSLLSFLRELRASEKPKKNLTYWLGTVVSNNDQLHYHILKAAQKCEAVEEVCRMYDEAMQPKSTKEVANRQNTDTTPEMVGELRYFRTAIKFHGSSSQSDHDEALEAWEDMVANPGKGWNAYWISYRASRVLSPALLDKASIDLSLSVQSSYKTKLEALCRSNQQAVREVRQSPHDPQFCLIRLHILQSNSKLADEEARRLLRGVFDGWPKELDHDSLRTRYATLAQILTIFDLDDDAVAAWQILKPRGSKETTTEDEAGSIAAPTGETTSPTTQSTTEAERASSPAPIFEAHMSYYRCDAECGTIWKAMLTDCWACKNCLCVQLCSPCYQKLQGDELSPLVCRKEHKFVYLPKFDEQVWSSVPDDSILVGGKLMTREQWLNQFRERWNVQQEQIDAYKLETARKLKATVCIATYVLKWKRKRMNKLKKIHRARTFPLLQNH